MTAVTDLTTAEARSIVSAMQDNPVLFIEEVLGSKLWSMQRDIANSVRDNRYTTVWACHGPGKTFAAAQIALWFLATHSPSKVITTAPTGRQVYSLLWSELRTAFERAENRGLPLGGRCLKTRLDFAPDWFAEGFSTTEWEPDRVQGYHSPHILIIVDEASGVPDGIANALEGLMASGHARMLLLGNPNVPAGFFYRSSVSRLFHRIQIPVWDTPNFRNLGIGLEDIVTGSWRSKVSEPLPHPHLVNPTWVAERHAEWGADSPLWRVRVDAEFPDPSHDADRVIPATAMMKAQITEYPDDARHAPVEVGVDVGRYGNDEAPIAIRAGRAALKERILFKRDTMQITGAVVQECREVGWDRVQVIRVDVIGMGSAPVDRLREIQESGDIPAHVDIVGANVALHAREPKRFKGQRDEVWWKMRELVMGGMAGGSGFSDEAVRQLTTPRYKVLSTGHIKVEDKDSLRKKERLGCSPDRADAWILAFVDVRGEQKPKLRIGRA